MREVPAENSLRMVDVMLPGLQSEFLADEVRIDLDATEEDPIVYDAAVEKIQERLDVGVGPVVADASAVSGHELAIGDAAGGDEFFEVGDGLFDDGANEGAGAGGVEFVI